jgi:hypothetical protein
MAVTPQSARFDTPEYYNIEIGTASAAGLTAISVGDWLIYSGSRITPTNAAHTGFWKASAAGVALEANPVYDPAGRVISNSALRFLRQGVIRGSAAFSGEPALGVGAYPASTGSAAFAVTGQTGVGATWQTGVKLSVSGGTGAGGSGVATVIGWRNAGNGGTGQLDLLVHAPRPDYY